MRIRMAGDWSPSRITVLRYAMTLPGKTSLGMILGGPVPPRPQSVWTRALFRMGGPDSELGPGAPERIPPGVSQAVRTW
jgi:hypothetical protein